MLVSWNWLKEYVALDMPLAELTNRLMMAGLNHESTNPLADDFAIDLEITSNRPDCLGHIGIAREISVLWDRPLKLSAATPGSGSTPISSLTKVAVQCPELCPRYTARVIQGVKVGPSPAWLTKRLATIGVTSINNIVDITNYVLMECGQPLHAFDFTKLQGREIIVREARAGEELQAIDHKTYKLEPGMCVIADAAVPVALGGVMGGAGTEVSSATKDVLIEAATFSPLSIRTTARKLSLHSPSSYRFERGTDVENLDWASRRCCELILELAGGELADGLISVGQASPQRPTVVLRFAHLQRILGIEIPSASVRRIMTALGCVETASTTHSVTVVPPSWRRDLTREIDLVEEAARIYGYDAIPEDARVPMVPSHRSDNERVLSRVRQTMTAAGFDEAMTISIVQENVSDTFSPWTDAESIVSNTPILRGADRLRRSLIPSLLEARQLNESLQNPVAELFETAHIYLPNGSHLPSEQWTLGLVSGGGFSTVKGAVESLLRSVNATAQLVLAETQQPLLVRDQAAVMWLNGERLGFIGDVTAAGLKQFNLRSATAVAEINLAVLAKFARLIPQYSVQSPFPAIARDLNLIVDEAVRWADLETTIRSAAGALLEQLDYQETYRDAKKDGPGKKRLLFSFTLRSDERTLTNEEADRVRHDIVAATHLRHGAALLA